MTAATAATAATVPPGTLREKLDHLRAEGRPMSMAEAVGVIVPLSVELAQRHEEGEHTHVHPSAIVLDEHGDTRVDPELAGEPPVHPGDRACLAPEAKSGAPASARESVYAIGAILYEMVTGELVGPGMRRPTEVNPQLPVELEAVLAKALVADPSHRPDDLRALAQAIHHLAPSGSIAPPPADESHLDHVGDFEVDVSLSMLPPQPKAGASPYEVAVTAAQPQISGVDKATSELAAMKARLESDPRPRYVVIKEGMDHGPFNAVELLQQIANHTFEENDSLRDTLLNDERGITDWPEFAPFAEHAKRHRVIAAERVALEASVQEERKSTTRKGLFGGLVLLGILGIAATWFVVQRGSRSDEVVVQGEMVTDVDTEGDLKVPKGSAAGGKGRRVVGSQGGFPILAGGMSCEAAQAAYVEEMKMGQKMQADITRAQYGAVLNSGSYLNGCGLPSSTSVDVCVAVQNGRAVGVTIRTEPSNAGVASCISRKVRGLSFPSHPKLDVTRTRFAAQ
jgi:eukaryotic-like serine/threonine-protein kinase